MRSAFLFVFTLLVFVSTGCGYGKGSLLTPDTTARAARKRGCIDVAVSVVSDSQALPTSALLMYELGNRCETAAPVDLGRVRVTGVTATGESVELVAFDPLHEIRSIPIEIATAGVETIRYDAPRGACEEHGIRGFDRICVDLEGITESSEGPARPCLSAAGEGRLTEAGHVSADGPTRAPRGAGAFGASWGESTSAPVRVDVGGTAWTTRTEGLRLSHDTYGGFDATKLGAALPSAALELRITGFVAGPAFVGGSVSLGLGAAEPVPVATPRETFSTESLFAHVPLGVIVGASTPRVAGVEARAEVLAGGRILAVTAEQDRTRPPEDQGRGSFFGAAWMVMPRVAADIWGTPFFTVAPWVGLDVARLPDWGGGLAFAVHLRPYDGRK